MRLTHLEAITAVLAAAAAFVAAAGGILAALRWIFSQGAASARLTGAVQSNTEATAELTEAFRHGAAEAEERWIDHDRRITRLESAGPGPAIPAQRRRGPG